MKILMENGGLDLRKKQKRSNGARNKKAEQQAGAKEAEIKEQLELITPSVLRFYPDSLICGNTYRAVWAIRDYPGTTEEQALLKHLGEKQGVTLHLYTRPVSAAEEKKMIANAANKNKMVRANTNDLKETVLAEHNLADVARLVSETHRNREPLLHTAVYLEMQAESREGLEELELDVQTELIRGRMNLDKLLLQQKEGFLSAMPFGKHLLGERFERVLPASSVANLYPFHYSGKLDGQGFYLGRDKHGSGIFVDFEKREEDKTNANILILGNSGQGKSYLLKILLSILRESGKQVICLDAEEEYQDLTEHLGGCFVDLMAGRFYINPLEVKVWDESGEAPEADAPEAFRQRSSLSQHIAFLKDFFRTARDFSDGEIELLEIMVSGLYKSWGIDNETDFEKLSSGAYPILSDLYRYLERAYEDYDEAEKPLYTKEQLQHLLLGLYSMAKGSEAKFFNGHTNITDDAFLTFGVKGLLQTKGKLKDAMLFNILSYMAGALLGTGNTVASLDEFYLFLTNITTVEYVRNFMKRVRKKNSAIILASQNLEDFNLEGIREYTRPLFAIPTHQFLFYPGSLDPAFFKEMLQLTESEYELIRYPERGVCLYKCGNERYHLKVIASDFRERLFGSAGGR